MKYLLDSHVVLWWLGMDTHKLREPLRNTIAEAEAVFISIATVWELEIKRSLGKLKLPIDDWEQVEASGLTFLPIELADALRAADLPIIHRDPFDRMMVAQALTRDLTLITRDARLLDDGVATLRA
ncbi:MAG: PIN domain nuclease [Hyphomicrobiales bacterium]|nr:MAG: PIN domain nuclease [Hyphomicrobiales bacterium]